MKNLKMRIATLLMAIVTMLSIFPVNAFAATSKNAVAIDANSSGQIQSLAITYTSGWGQAWTDHYVYYDANGENQIPNKILPAGVGFTILAETDVSYLIDTYNGINSHLEEVWISRNYVTVDTANAQAGNVTSSAYVYASVNPNNSVSVGNVYVGDIVTILAKSGTYYFIEFNDTNYMRKRGWVSIYSVTPRETTQVGALDTVLGNTTRYTEGTTYVYAAPGTGYVACDVLSNNSKYTLVGYTTIHGHDYALISYLSGFISFLHLGYIEV